MSEIESPSQVSCWNTVGVWGSQAPRCEKLDEVIHCRNCPVYWNAGREVFEKRIPEGYIEQWTRVISSDVEPVSKLSQSIISFRLADEWFSLSTRNFIEVSQIKSIHKIPHQSNDLVLGVVNVGGEVRLCFSLACLLGVANDETKQINLRGVYKRYLVVQIDDSDYVFPVDEVGGVYRYDPEDLKQVPVTIEAEKAELLLGVLDIEGNKIACIDVNKLAQTFGVMLGG